MARHIRHPFESRTSRLKLDIRRKPHNGPPLARGVLLHYRRNKGNGTWVLKAMNGDGDYWTSGFAEADDYAESNGDPILTFFQAQDRAKVLAGRGIEADATTAPVTVAEALIDYRAVFYARNARPDNADRPRPHLTATLFAKPVALLASKEMKTWRDRLLGTIAPATINRTCGTMCAAFELAAQHDPRIKNRDAWEVGLAGLPNAQQARNVVISDATVHRLIAAAYERDPALGLFVETAATTGARSSQLAGLLIEDLHDHPTKPRLMMPKSGKGSGRNRSQKKTERYSVPITIALSKKLKAAAAGRASDAPLLVRSDGSSWGDHPSLIYRNPVREIVAAIGEDPDIVTKCTR